MEVTRPRRAGSKRLGRNGRHPAEVEAGHPGDPVEDFRNLSEISSRQPSDEPVTTAPRSQVSAYQARARADRLWDQRNERALEQGSRCDQGERDGQTKVATAMTGTARVAQLVASRSLSATSTGNARGRSCRISPGGAPARDGREPWSPRRCRSGRRRPASRRTRSRQEEVLEEILFRVPDRAARVGP